MKPNGDLSKELSKLGEYTLHSRGDAIAICKALQQLPSERSEGEGYRSNLYSLVALFQDVKSVDAPAIKVLGEEGIPQIIRIYDILSVNPTKDSQTDLIFMLKILTMYGSSEGANRVISAARKPLDPDNYLWSVVFRLYAQDHPHRDRVFRELSADMPAGFIAVGFLDTATALALAGELDKHPFDSPAGHNRLEAWLTDDDPDHYSYAHSATAALPFIDAEQRNRLLPIAYEHPDESVQMEAAWAAAKSGDKGGVERLAKFCLDVNNSAVACEYLSELGRQDAIPAEAHNPDFEAKAEFAVWLAHPSELGRPPDKLEIVDSRILSWPPDAEQERFWLIKYTVHDTTGLEDDDVGVGLVGSMTFCLFSYNLDQRPPEDAYAIHSYWEMEGHELILEEDVGAQGQYETMLGQWTGDALEKPMILAVADISPKLNYPQGLVAVASAVRNGEKGWVVLDGPRSAWYPESDMPDTTHSTILNIHVGRQLLGFRDRPDRKKYLKTGPPKRDPRQVVNTYERLIDKTMTGDQPYRKKMLTGMQSLLGRHLQAYADACEATGTSTKAEAIIKVYERILKSVDESNDDIKEEAYSMLAPLGGHFEAYVDALVNMGRKSAIIPLLQFFQPKWEHYWGYTMLGTAAFKAGDYDSAEQFFTKLRRSSEDWPQSETMGLLARIWRRRGKADEAEELLIDSMRRLLKEEKKATGSERNQFEEWYQNHRSTYLDLFPERGVQHLAKIGLPASTLP
ncbi:MAG: hypothetical protein QGG42_00805 [Phycisphaerae bacterium]|nr:hypothetical protein [Phycisphaerae bacterium]